MTYQPTHNPTLRDMLPSDFTVEQGLILSVRNSANWLECAAIEEYPLELRSAWRQRGKEWLDFAIKISGPGLTFSSQEHIWTLDDELERTEKFWDQTKVLGSFCRSHARE